LKSTLRIPTARKADSEFQADEGASREIQRHQNFFQLDTTVRFCIASEEVSFVFADNQDRARRALHDAFGGAAEKQML
jgi:hypothetical protein